MSQLTVILKDGSRVSRYVSYVKWSKQRGKWRGLCWIKGARRTVVSNSMLGPFREDVWGV